MKRLFVISLILVASASAVFAQGQQEISNQAVETVIPRQNQQAQGAEQGQQIQIEQQTQNQGEEGQLIIMQQQVTAAKVSELKQTIQQKQQEMNQEAQLMGEKERKVYQNQNQVRLAVHSLLEMKDVIGGIGPQVSQIAQEFNNSVQATIKAEEKIQTRNRIVRFFVGGDAESAEQVEQEVSRNRERIQRLYQLEEQCDCDEQIKTMLQEQIQNMEQEQERLRQLAQNEKEYKWSLGRLLNWAKGLF